MRVGFSGRGDSGSATRADAEAGERVASLGGDLGREDEAAAGRPTLFSRSVE